MSPSSERILARIAQHTIWIPWAFGAPVDPRWPVPSRASSDRPVRPSTRPEPRAAHVVLQVGRRTPCRSSESTISA
jgi:hypothetical protein